MEKEINKRKKIALDLDEVLADFVRGINDFYNCIYKPSFKRDIVFEDYRSYNLGETWNLTNKQVVEVILNFYRNPLFKKIKPIEGSQKGMVFLSRKNELIIITSRPEFIIRETEEWVDKYYPNKISKIIFTNQYGMDSSQRFKSPYCLKEGIETIVEDNLETAIECSKRGMRTFLLDKPWNQQEDIDGIIRVKNWKELLKKLEK